LIPGVRIFNDFSDLRHLATNKTIWIAGGSEIYRQMLPQCSELYLTRVHRNVEGDTFFPKFEDQFDLTEKVLKQPDFTIERWVKKA
jgi:dihydrofolate reductase